MHEILTDGPRFKLHLRDANNDSQSSSFDFNSDIPALPPNRTVIDIFADFLRYLHSCTREYIKESHPNGEEIWDNANITNDIDYVLSHPNGWEGKEQTEMRKAAVEADLIPDTNDGHKRLSFVTEGEASLHFAVECGVLAENVTVSSLLVLIAHKALTCMLFRCFPSRRRVLLLLMLAAGLWISVPTERRWKAVEIFSARVLLQSVGHLTFLPIFPLKAAPLGHFHGSVFVTMAADKMMEGRSVDC